ncbi:mitochondrial carrier domain-containing protein [Phycomyces nitens]|nr:mitochondrial carrier domain-containing protein [Phycomyces nitens]
MSSQKQSLSQAQVFKYHFIAGAVGLSLSYSCMHPLDTIKTRIQADPLNGWKTLFTRQTAQSLGKGFFVSALGAAGQGGARFSTYEFCKSHLLPTKDNGNTKLIPWLGNTPATALSAVIGDLASSVIKVPREVITAKLQTDHYSNILKGERATAGFVVRQTIIEEGPRGLFKGFWAIAARDSPFMIILLVSYENFKAFHHRSVRDNWLQTPRKAYDPVVANAPFEELEADIPTFRSIMYGGISGFLAGYFTTPMDVLRTRMITQRATPNRQSASVTDVAKSMISRVVSQHKTPAQRAVNIGRAFFVGAMPRSFWWFGICGIFFPTYETLKSVMVPQ